ncbi:hypothetical protein CAAN1_02S06238 [[Candida] anglica]|uniref:Transmembrane protein 231 n=1 Tax=[Candida] anglica TaxID=148631 RepID=A0ABP0EC58_9ASCO
MSFFTFTLATTRRSIYVSTVLSAIFLVLLPWSVLSYLRFYSVIIPNASYELPLRFVSRYGIAGDARGVNELLSVAGSKNINYDLQLNLRVFCPKNLIGDSKLVFGNLTLQHDSWHSESTSTQSTFLIHCDPRTIHSTFNSWIPYNLRLWVPPFLTHNERVNIVSTKIGSISALGLANHLGRSDGKIEYELDTPLLVDIEKSSLLVNVEWQGIRYYLFNHYYICFLIGVTLFWATSSIVNFVISMTVWYILRKQVTMRDLKID